jgi:exonuclease III
MMAKCPLGCHRASAWDTCCLACGAEWTSEGAAPDLRPQGFGSDQQPAAAASTEGAGPELRILTWNTGSLCPQSNLRNKLALEAMESIVGLHSALHDLIFLPEAHLSSVPKHRKAQLGKVQVDGYAFQCSQSGQMAMYIKRQLMPTCHREFPPDVALMGQVGLVTSTDDSWAVVGVYAPNMRVGGRAKGAGPNEREAFDVALFKLLDGLQALGTVALVGDLNLVWGANQGNGKHNELVRQWEHMLGQLGFQGPLDDPNEQGKVVPTSRRYPRDGDRRAPPPSRVDFLSVRSRQDVVAGYERHDRFWRELAWPAVGPDGVTKPTISEHTPLSLRLRLTRGREGASEMCGKKRARE